MERFRLLFKQKVTRVIAPMGYGKTCALAEFVQSDTCASGRVLWLTIDARDVDSVQFWKHVFSLLGFECDVEEGREWEHAALSTFGTGDEQPSSPDEVLLVFDGVEHICTSGVFQELLNFVQNASPNYHVVISGRFMPKRLSQAFDALGQLTISEFDLTFSSDETQQLVQTYSDLARRMWGIELEMDGALKLVEGWPQGISMAVRSAGDALRADAAVQFNGASTYADEYFQAIFELPLGHRVIAMFEKAAVFERFCQGMLEFALDEDDLSGEFEEMLSCGLPVVSCVGGRGWYRFNHLFADWLRRQVLETSLADVREQCLRASEWFRDRKQFNEAAKYMVMACDFEYIENVTGTTCGLWRARRHSHYLLWLCNTPASDFPNSSLLCMLTVWAYNSAGNISDAREWASLFAECAAADSAKGLIAPDVVQRALNLLELKHDAMEGRCMSALERCRDMLQDTTTLEPSVQCVIYQSRGEAFERMGQLGTAAEEYIKAQACSNVDETKHHLYFNMLDFAEVQYSMGNLPAAAETCKRLLTTCPPDFSFNKAAHALLGLVLVEENQLDEAKRHIDLALDHASPYRNIDLYLEILLSESLFLVAQGKLSDAYEVISTGVVMGERVEVPRAALLKAYLQQATVAYRRGNVQDLKVAGHKFTEHLYDDDVCGDLMLQFIKAMVAESAGDFEGARSGYEFVISRADAREFNTLLIRALVSKAVLCNRMEDYEGAYAAVRDIIRLFAECGFVRSILDGGAPMRTVLRDYLSKRDVGAATKARAKRLLAAFEAESRHAREQGIEVQEDVQVLPGADELTDREHEVLDLLNTGMSRKEISEALCISVNTTKRHIANIYAKLGVSSKKQALTVAFSAHEDDE